MNVLRYSILTALITTQLIIVICSKTAMAQQKWYKPVNTGQHNLNIVAEKEVGPKDLYSYFSGKPGRLFRKQFENELSQAMKDWKGENSNLLNGFKNDPYFVINPDRKTEYIVAGFSDEKVNIQVYFEYGSSRWHHYHALLANLIVPRNEFTDSLFNMKNYDELYKTGFMGLSHGSSLKDVEGKLGIGYFEYLGQTLQLQNIYYEKFDVEICLQNGTVKYIKKGKPGWMDSDNVIKRN